ncbi:MAG TPA: hypothetical protein V6C89_07465 [Drouetiella sp.]|jgi:hypothetical protein
MDGESDGQNPEPDGIQLRTGEASAKSDRDNTMSDRSNTMSDSVYNESIDSSGDASGLAPDGSAGARPKRVAQTMLDISHFQKKAEGKVAKTLLDQQLPTLQHGPKDGQGDEGDEQAAKPDSNSEFKLESKPARKLKRVSRTMLELDIEALAEAAAASNEAAPTARYVAKTMLDHSMLFKAVSKSADVMEQKAAEVAKERALAPVELHEPIAPDGKVANCQWAWPNSLSGKERYRACGVCQAAVYDFDGWEREQAEALIFQRENLKRPKFFIRDDGKFMTRKCPREVARKMRLLTASLLAFVSILSALVLMFMAQTSKMEVVSTTSSLSSGHQHDTDNAGRSAPVTSGEASPAIPSMTSASVAPGWVHYENGKVTRGPVSASDQSDGASGQQAGAAAGQAGTAAGQQAGAGSVQQAGQQTPVNVAAPEASEPAWQDTSK